MRMFKTLTILFALSLATAVWGEIAVYSDKGTKEIVFIGDEKNIIISAEDADRFEKTILPQDIEFYSLDQDYSVYKLINNKKFVLNTEKISEQENKRKADEAAKDKKNADFITAKEKLMALGLTSDEVDSLK